MRWGDEGRGGMRVCGHRAYGWLGTGLFRTRRERRPPQLWYLLCVDLCCVPVLL